MLGGCWRACIAQCRGWTAARVACTNIAGACWAVRSEDVLRSCPSKGFMLRCGAQAKGVARQF